MSSHIFLNDFVFWTPAVSHEAIKNDLLPKVQDRYALTKGSVENRWLCKVNTEMFHQDHYKYRKLIEEGVYPALDKLFTELPFQNKPAASTVVDVWYNHYDIGFNQELHTHIPYATNAQAPNLSGVYYLELDEPNNTVFYSYDAVFAGFSQPAFRATDIKEGDIVLFPSKLMHYVLPATASRTTIAFNIQCTWGN